MLRHTGGAHALTKDVELERNQILEHAVTFCANACPKYGPSDPFRQRSSGACLPAGRDGRRHWLTSCTARLKFVPV
jgi:hypothetical protein